MERERVGSSEIDALHKCDVLEKRDTICYRIKLIVLGICSLPLSHWPMVFYRPLKHFRLLQMLLGILQKLTVREYY